MRFFPTVCLCLTFLASNHAIAESEGAATTVPLPSQRPVALAALTDINGAAAFLDSALSTAGLRIDEVRHQNISVPRVMVSRMPSDMHLIDDVAARKRIFLKVMLPLILKVNEEILAERRRLEHLDREIASGARLALSDEAWLDYMTQFYGVESGHIGELLRRVDVVPVALALAQSAIESGWGTSRFARKGNAVFGQKSWNSHAGLVPRNRDPDKTHVVKSFRDLRAAVLAYVCNLNRHFAYTAFRDLRARLRENGQPLDSHALATTLDRYAEEPDYISHVHTVINQNRLTDFDTARLAAVKA